MGELLAYRDNSAPWGNLQSGQFTFTGVFTRVVERAWQRARLRGLLAGAGTKWDVNNQPPAAAQPEEPAILHSGRFQRFLPNLTINLGLRYQIQNGWAKTQPRGRLRSNRHETKTNTPGAVWFAPNNGRSALEATDYKIFLPRVGFAWSPKKSWAVRGGFGIYRVWMGLDTYGAGMGFGSNSTGSVTSSRQCNSGRPAIRLRRESSLRDGVPIRAPITVRALATSLITHQWPLQWSFSIQRELGSGAVAEAAMCSHGTDLSFPADINQLRVGSLGLGQSGARTRNSRVWAAIHTAPGRTMIRCSYR